MLTERLERLVRRLIESAPIGSDLLIAGNRAKLGSVTERGVWHVAFHVPDRPLMAYELVDQIIAWRIDRATPDETVGSIVGELEQLVESALE